MLGRPERLRISSRGGALARRPVPRRQARFGGGDSLAGRRLYPPLVEAAFREVRVRPRMVRVDGKGPDRAESFSKNARSLRWFEVVRQQALFRGLIGLAEVCLFLIHGLSILDTHSR